MTESIRTVRDTVTTMLREKGLSSYISQAEPVIAALEDRESDIAATLLDYATSQGLSPANATDVLRRAGLDWAEPPEDTGDGMSDVESEIVETVRESLDTLVNKIDELLEARRS